MSFEWIAQAYLTFLILVNGAGSIWSTDYSEYDEYDLGDDSTNPQSSVGTDEKEIGNDLPPGNKSTNLFLQVSLVFASFRKFFNRVF